MILLGCEWVKNITVSVDEGTYRGVRIVAAERGTSVSALVRGALNEIASSHAARRPSEQWLRTLGEIRESMMARGSRFSAADRLPREELHDRTARRSEKQKHGKAHALR